MHVSFAIFKAKSYAEALLAGYSCEKWRTHKPVSPVHVRFTVFSDTAAEIKEESEVRILIFEAIRSSPAYHVCS